MTRFIFIDIILSLYCIVYGVYMSIQQYPILSDEAQLLYNKTIIYSGLGIVLPSYVLIDNDSRFEFAHCIIFID